MMMRARQAGFDCGKQPAPPGSWLVGLMVGMTIGNLAAGAMMLGAGAAIRQTILDRSPAGPGTRQRP